MNSHSNVLSSRVGVSSILPRLDMKDIHSVASVCQSLEHLARHIFLRRLEQIHIHGDIFQLARFDASNQQWQVVGELKGRTQLPHAVVLGEVFCSALLDGQYPGIPGTPRCLTAPLDKINFTRARLAQQFRDGRPLHHLIQDLNHGRIDPHDRFLQLQVAGLLHNKNILLYCRDNLRLKCLKQHQTDTARQVHITVFVQEWSGLPDGIVGIFGVEHF